MGKIYRSDSRKDMTLMKSFIHNQDDWRGKNHRAHRSKKNRNYKPDKFKSEARKNKIKEMRLKEMITN